MYIYIYIYIFFFFKIKLLNIIYFKSPPPGPVVETAPCHRHRVFLPLSPVNFRWKFSFTKANPHKIFNIDSFLPILTLYLRDFRSI
jgi:hypothetical protein